ncbi:sialidase family protein [Oceanivirga salmonicida]|uniref:sialidase family protein n=1 Tax=Oceanivirga salmonicida TaxID=1769291 RepID=UPI00083079AE|nr:sialidase family protein [Oceanivirga salmonicida]
MKNLKFLVFSVILASGGILSFAADNSIKYNPELKKGYNLTNRGTKWPGIGPNEEAPGTVKLGFSRIPAMIITNDNKMVVMFDLRWNSLDDKTRIDPGVAISSDGGFNWDKKTAWSVKTSKSDRRRHMDSTLLYDPIKEEIYAMHGSWSEGIHNWYINRKEYRDKKIWSAVVHKSKDHGKTWEEHIEFDKDKNANIYLPNTKNGDPIVGFLGGVGTGTVLKDGTLVFPIQTAHQHQGIGATIMYSKDHGKTWQMPESSNIIGPNQQSLENMVFQIGNKLVMTGRGEHGKNNRWAYYTEDLGKTWKVYDPVHNFGGSKSAAAQGSSIYVTLPNGRKVLLVSKVDGAQSDNDKGKPFTRSNTSLWVLDALDPTHKVRIADIRPGEGEALGDGYSSLAYKNGHLFVAYEDHGDIKVKDLTEFIPEIEKKSIEWGLENHREKEEKEIKELEKLNNKQKEILVEKLKKADDTAIIIALALDKEMKKLDEKLKNSEIEKNNKKSPLVSNLKKYEKVKEVITDTLNKEKGTYVNHKNIEEIRAELDKALEALNQKIDLEKYVKLSEEYLLHDNDIINNFNKNLYVELGISRRDDISPITKLGFNYDINKQFKIGAFAEYEKSANHNLGLGINFVTNIDKNNIVGFVRSGLTIPNSKKVNFSADTYLRYARNIDITPNFEISPHIGVYGSYSPKTKFDDDAILTPKFFAVVDAGINLKYSVNGFAFNIEPVFKTRYGNEIFVQQSNDEKISKKVEVGKLAYDLSLGFENKFKNNIILGANLKIGKDFFNKWKTESKISLGYNW